jgi:cytochrome c biogenesis protein
MSSTPASRPSRPAPPSATPRQAPDLASTDPPPSTSGRPDPRPPPSQPPPALRAAWKRLLSRLSSLPLAIADLAALAAMSAVGTVIEQGKSLDYYQETYPIGAPGLAGLVNWRTITALHLDGVYASPAFLGACALLAACLAACTATRQWPAARVARAWRFARTPEAAYAQAKTPGGGGQGSAGVAAALPAGRAADLGAALAARGYQVFVQRGAGGGGEGGEGETSSSSSSPTCLYAFKGLAGKLGPIAVHASLLLTLAGTAVGALGGCRGQALAPVGTAFPPAAVLAPASPLARPPPGARGTLLRVDGFDVLYRDDGSVSQFVSDLSIIDDEGGGGSGDADRVLASGRISVNVPLRYRGLTVYQADYGIAALTVTAPASPLSPAGGGPFKLPAAELSGGAAGVSGRAWATFLPLPDSAAGGGSGGGGGAAPPTPAPSTTPRGVTLLARDFQTVVLYSADGSFAGVRRPGSGKPITVDGMEIVVGDVVGSTGLELKADPGVPTVYAGFAGLMVSTLVSYLSHSQVWAVEDAATGRLAVGGRTNRAALGFKEELEAAMAAVPERP